MSWPPLTCDHCGSEDIEAELAPVRSGGVTRETFVFQCRTCGLAWRMLSERECREPRIA